ncbi:MAG: S8/S53 family peptidase [Oligoflexia bacterium]|nr:S8/S53 family peptidase [Oligoflexia bacterium]
MKKLLALLYSPNSPNSPIFFLSLCIIQCYLLYGCGKSSNGNEVKSLSMARKQQSSQQQRKVNTISLQPTRIFIRDRKIATPVFYPFEKCPVHNTRSKYWAQLAVDADLMQAELKRMHIPTGHTSVAVIDTGFDFSLAESRFDSPKITAQQSNTGCGSADQDENGHGTMVAGLIGGTDNIGIAPDVNISVYRVTKTGNQSVTTMESILAAIKQACNDGNEIINLSFNSEEDEHGRLRQEVVAKKFIHEMLERGCLIVAAEGNDAYRELYSTNDLDDSLLRVTAGRPGAKIAPFSSIGEVIAPGTLVATIANTTNNFDNIICEKNKLILGSGTSFATPIISSVAGEVLGVLKKNINATKNATKNQITQANKVKIVTRILKASELKGVINGLRAVLLAEAWGRGINNTIKTKKNIHVTIPSVAELKTLLKETYKHYCEKNVDITTEELLLSIGRKKLSLCSELDPTVAQDLIKKLLYLKAVNNNYDLLQEFGKYQFLFSQLK